MEIKKLLKILFTSLYMYLGTCIWQVMITQDTIHSNELKIYLMEYLYIFNIMISFCQFCVVVM
jgi:hypothetical protein